MSKNQFHAKAHAGAKRVNPNIFKWVEPTDSIGGPHNAPLRAMKSSDYTDEVSRPLLF
jgi:hypothetical protein